MELSLWVVTLSPGVWLLQRATTFLYTVDSASFYLSLHLCQTRLLPFVCSRAPQQPTTASQELPENPLHCWVRSSALLLGLKRENLLYPPDLFESSLKGHWLIAPPRFHWTWLRCHASPVIQAEDSGFGVGCSIGVPNQDKLESFPPHPLSSLYCSGLLNLSYLLFQLPEYPQVLSRASD